MYNSLPEFGSTLLCASLVAAAFTVAVSLAAAGGRPRLLKAARLGTYGTLALLTVATLVLAYAFVTHDFRLRYVVNYSDRTLSTALLLAALWGGQDGSLLSWTLLSAVFTAACAWSLRGRYRELQPYVLATLLVVVIFFIILMLFVANPFSTSASGAPPDGRGLNYQLRNFYMLVHPPSLYLGFTSAAVPFAFAIAALVTGRLNNEWIIASRKWMLLCWLFLTIGNVLGMLWAYEELGWGGYWAWDPVENASLLPWITATAYLHSIVIQQRRNRQKRWNLILVCATFVLTIFGTFLTRSGLIASVHAFAKSGIGVFFVWFMVLTIAGFCGLAIWRRRELRSGQPGATLISRETSFLLHNWGLLGLTAFIIVATVWPRLSEWLLARKTTIGPEFYNTFVPPLALALIVLMGLGPVLGWRATSRAALRRALLWPGAAAVTLTVFHLIAGARLGYPPFVAVEPIFAGPLGVALAGLVGKLPVVAVALAGFNIAVVIQEFVRGLRARRLAQDESIIRSLVTLVARARRRYGGLIAHVGLALMFVGFAGRSWGKELDFSVKPGGQITVEQYQLTYEGIRTETDHEKQMIFADLTVSSQGEQLGTISPARYLYRAGSKQASTEVARYGTLASDLYVIVGMLNTRSGVASFRIHVNPWVSWVWIGALIIALGALVGLWPQDLRKALAERGPGARLAERRPGVADLRKPTPGIIAAAFGIVIALTAGVAGWVQGAGLTVLVLAGGSFVVAIATLWSCLRSAVDQTAMTGAEAFALGSYGSTKEQKRAVLQVLRDLQVERALGTINEQDFEDSTARSQAEAQRLLTGTAKPKSRARQLAEKLLAARLADEHGRNSDPKMPDRSKQQNQNETRAPHSLQCLKCEIVNEADAVFCKKCGQRLAPDSSKSGH